MMVSPSVGTIGVGDGTDDRLVARRLEMGGALHRRPALRHASDARTFFKKLVVGVALVRGLSEGGGQKAS